MNTVLEAIHKGHQEHEEYGKLNACEWCRELYEAAYSASRFCSQVCAEKAYAEATAIGRYTDQDQRWLLPYRRAPRLLVNKNPEHWNRAKQAWAEMFPQNLYLWGDEGTGKTSLACWLLCRRVESGFSVRQVTCLDIELHLKYAFNPEARPKQIITELCNVTCLLIDDLSAPEWTPRGLSLLRYILDRRHVPGREQETFCTSNLEPVDLSKMIDGIAGHGAGVQTLRRLQPVVTVNMVGGSYRMELGSTKDTKGTKGESAQMELTTESAKNTKGESCQFSFGVLGADDPACPSFVRHDLPPMKEGGDV